MKSKFECITKLAVLSVCAIFLFNTYNKTFYNKQPYLNISVDDAISLEGLYDAEIGMSTFSNYYNHDDVEDYIRDVDKSVKRYIDNMNRIVLSKIYLGKPPEVNLLIDSYGGSVYIMLILSRAMHALSDKGIKFKCYVSNAISAAFYLLINNCDKRIMVPGANIGQHMVHIGREMTTVGAILTSRQMSDNEAKSLGIEKDRWWNISRKLGEVTYFDEKRALLLGIVTSIYKR